MNMMDLITRFVKDEEGQGMAEYALILVLIAVVVILALKTLGGNVSNVLDNVSDALENP